MIYLFQSGLIYWVLHKQSKFYRGKGRMWALVCRPHELCLLHIFTYWEIDATLLCSVGLRYIWRDNEIVFCSDWRGWWHRYEIAVVFTWLLCVIYTDTSLSNGSFDLHQFMLIESQWNKHVAHCQLYTPGRLVCFLFLLNNAWEMIETRGDFYRKKTNGQADTVFSITLCTASVIIRNIQRK